MGSAFDDIPDPKRRSKRFLDVVLVLAGVLAGLAAIDVRTNYLEYVCGRFSWQAPLPCVACLVAPLFGGVACWTLVMGMLIGNWLRRGARLLFAATLIILVFIAPQRNFNDAYLDGLAAWARGLNTQAMRSAALAAVPANAIPTSPPYSWLMSDMDAPYGMSIAPALLRGVLGGYEPDEVRVVPKTQIVVAFRPTAFHKVYVATGPGLTAPPSEFDHNRILDFRHVKPDVVIWLEETH